MRIVFLGTPAVCGSFTRGYCGGGTSGGGSVYPARSAEGQRQPLGGIAGKLQRHEARSSGVAAGTDQTAGEFRPSSRSHADLMVVVGYGQIIPQSIIDLPRSWHSECAWVAAARNIGARPLSSGPSRRATQDGRYHHANRRGSGYWRYVVEEHAWDRCPDETSPELPNVWRQWVQRSWYRRFEDIGAGQLATGETRR